MASVMQPLSWKQRAKNATKSIATWIFILHRSIITTTITITIITSDTTETAAVRAAVFFYTPYSRCKFLTAWSVIGSLTARA